LCLRLPPSLLTMSRPSTPSTRTPGASAGGTTRSHREDVLQFLDNLDSFEGDPKADSNTTGNAQAGERTKAGSKASTSSGAPPASGEDAQSVLDFLDEIVTSRDRKPNPSLASNSGSKRPPSVASASAAGATSGISRSSSRTTLRDATGASSGNRKSTDSVRGSSYLTPSTPVNAPASANAGSTAAQAAEKLQEAPLPARSETPAAATAGGGWGWGSVWSQASTVIQQARTVAEEVRCRYQHATDTAAKGI
jgi:hypothetical protein